MHELSIAMSIVDAATEQAAKMGNVRVVSIHLKLGPLSGVIKEALLSAFEMAREGTPFQETRLVIEEMPVIAFCTKCQTERTIESIQEMRCPVCGTVSPDVRGGRELEISAMDVVDEIADPIG